VSLHWIFILRTRYGVPAIAALLVAMVLSYPLEALIALQPALRAVPLIEPLFRPAVFIGSFTVTNIAWRTWLARRPALIMIEGGRARRRTHREIDAPQLHG
jgi:hypothetical protein